MRNIKYISNDIVKSIINDDVQYVKSIVYKALDAHFKQKHLVQPPKIKLFRAGVKHKMDRIVGLSAYYSGEKPVAGMKWISRNPNNISQGLNNSSALIILNDVETNLPIAILDGTLISTMRTFAISLIAIENVHPNPEVVSCIGIGSLGRLHLQHLQKLFPSIKQIRCYSKTAKFKEYISDSIIQCDTYKESLKAADLVVLSTNISTPYIAFNDLSGNIQLINNLALFDIKPEVFNNFLILVDDLSLCLKTKITFAQAYKDSLIPDENIYQLSSYIKDKIYHGPMIFNPLGMAIEDLFIAKAIYDIVSKREGTITLPVT